MIINQRTLFGEVALPTYPQQMKGVISKMPWKRDLFLLIGWFYLTRCFLSSWIFDHGRLTDKERGNVVGLWFTVSILIRYVLYELDKAPQFSHKASQLSNIRTSRIRKRRVLSDIEGGEARPFGSVLQIPLRAPLSHIVCDNKWIVTACPTERAFRVSIDTLGRGGVYKKFSFPISSLQGIQQQGDSVVVIGRKRIVVFDTTEKTPPKQRKLTNPPKRCQILAVEGDRVIFYHPEGIGVDFLNEETRQKAFLIPRTWKKEESIRNIQVMASRVFLNTSSPAINSIELWDIAPEGEAELFDLTDEREGCYSMYQETLFAVFPRSSVHREETVVYDHIDAFQFENPVLRLEGEELIRDTRYSTSFYPFISDQGIFFTQDETGVICCYDVHTKVHKKNLLSVTGTKRPIDSFYANEEKLYIAYRGGDVEVWNILEGTLLYQIKGNGDQDTRTHLKIGEGKLIVADRKKIEIYRSHSHNMG